jgi:hypothetical protein
MGASRRRSNDKGSEPTTEPYGALSKEWLEQWITEHGPYAYHLLRRAHLAQVLKEGLIPWDERETAKHNQQDEMAPRPGHVYVGLDAFDLENWGAEMLATDDELAMVAVDLRELDIRRIVADEDIFAVLGDDTRPWGLPACEFGAAEKYASSGEWAEAVRLGGQPGITESSAQQTGRLAIRGRIEASLLHEVENE